MSKSKHFVDITGGMSTEEGDKALRVYSIKKWLKGERVQSIIYGMGYYPTPSELELHRKMLPVYEEELRTSDRNRYIRKAKLTGLGGYVILGYFKAVEKMSKSKEVKRMEVKKEEENMDRDLVRIHCRMYGCDYKKDSPHICLKDGITVRKKVLFDAYGEPCIVAVCTTYITEEEMAKIMEETKTAAAKQEEVKKEDENMAELPVYTLPDRWICKKCRAKGFSPSKCRKYFERKLENTYAIINTFDRVVSKDRFTDPDFFNYYDHPEGKHHLECSGQISNPEVVKLVQHILRHHSYGWKPKKWWQFWRKY